MKIVTLTAENVKRIKAVEITPNEHVQVISGRNAQGKSSVMDAIWLGLGGGDASKATARPIRDGEDHASVRLDLGDYVVTRTWVDGKTVLKVKSADGANYSSPQAILDGLVGRMSFDPLAFTRLSAREQRDALMSIVELPFDPAELDAQRAELYAERTEAGRNLKQLEGQLAGFADIAPGTPDEEQSAVDLIKQIDAARALRAEQEGDRQAVCEAADDIAAAEAEVARWTTRLAEARLEKEAAEARIAKHEPVPDVDALYVAVQNVEATNRAVRNKAERAAVARRVSGARDAVTALSGEINAIDKKKARGLAEAAFPVDGLAFDADGVTYGGVPFSQASSAEQIRVSIAMAMALNPRLRVIRILDGSLLDPESLAIVKEMAEANDFQIWIERVGDGDGGVVIEDGEVVS